MNKEIDEEMSELIIFIILSFAYICAYIAKLLAIIINEWVVIIIILKVYAPSEWTCFY